MKRFRNLLPGALALLLPAGAASAQDPDKEALKKKILQEVEKRLKEEQEKLYKDIAKIVEEEVAKLRKMAPDTPKPAPTPMKARGYLGIYPAELTETERQALGVKGGVKIREVLPDTPADKAGLKVDDVIVGIDGRAIDSPQEVPPIVQAAGAGAKLKFEIVRGGKKEAVEATLGRHPGDAQEPKGDLRERVKKFLEREEEPKAGAPKASPRPRDPTHLLPPLDEDLFEELREKLAPLGLDLDQFFERGDDGRYRLNENLLEMLKSLDLWELRPGRPAPEKKEPLQAHPPAKPAPRPWLGIVPEDLSEEMRAQLPLEDGVGLLVSEVLPGSPAGKGGIRKNDVLVKLDGTSVKGEETLAGFMDKARAGQVVAITVLRQGKEQTLKVMLVEREE